MSVRRGDGALACTVRLHDTRDLVTVVARVRRLFDLDADPVAADAVLAGDPALAPLLLKRPGLRAPGSVDGFETALRTIVGQQISVRGARTVLARIVAEHGTPAFDGEPWRLFPTADTIAALDPAGLPMPQVAGAQRGRPGQLRRRTALDLDPGADRDEMRARLLAMPGIGPWTADYLRDAHDVRPGRPARQRSGGAPRRRRSRPRPARRTSGLGAVAQLRHLPPLGAPRLRRVGPSSMTATEEHTMRYTLIASPLGDLLAARDDVGITALYLPTGTQRPAAAGTAGRATTPRSPTCAASSASTSPASAPSSTCRCTRTARTSRSRSGGALLDIPYGQTATYGQTALAIGNPTASRAVGLANGQNPISIVVPCHRVIGADGSLTGYGGGLEAKQWLLAHEVAHSGLFA